MNKIDNKTTIIYLSIYLFLKVLCVCSSADLLPPSPGDGLCLPGGGFDSVGQWDPRRFVWPLPRAADSQTQGLRRIILLLLLFSSSFKPMTLAYTHSPGQTLNWDNKADRVHTQGEEGQTGPHEIITMKLTHSEKVRLLLSSVFCVCMYVSPIHHTWSMWSEDIPFPLHSLLYILLLLFCLNIFLF